MNSGHFCKIIKSGRTDSKNIYKILKKPPFPFTGFHELLYCKTARTSFLPYRGGQGFLRKGKFPPLNPDCKTGWTSCPPPYRGGKPS